MTPNPNDVNDVSLGEVYRLQQALQANLVDLTKEVRERHHAIAGKVDTVIGPVSTLTIRMANAESQLERIDGEVKDVTKQAAKVSGGFAVLAIIAGMIPWPWRGGS